MVVFKDQEIHDFCENTFQGPNEIFFQISFQGSAFLLFFLNYQKNKIKGTSQGPRDKFTIIIFQDQRLEF